MLKITNMIIVWNFEVMAATVRLWKSMIVKIWIQIDH